MQCKRLWHFSVLLNLKKSKITVGDFIEKVNRVQASIMDIYSMYTGDYSSSFRMNMLRDYEKHPYGTFEGNARPQKSYYSMVQGESLSKTTRQRSIRQRLIHCLDSSPEQNHFNAFVASLFRRDLFRLPLAKYKTYTDK